MAMAMGVMWESSTLYAGGLRCGSRGRCDG